jgi:LDH2 family malate/lactate/ureidoglycolate dehydrogenase
MAAKEVYLEPAGMKAFATQVYTAMGLPKGDAELGADQLYWANIRGVDSHGIQWLVRMVEFLDKGYLKPTPNVKVLAETPATALWDADQALGAAVFWKAMQSAMEKAKKMGIGWVNVRNMVTPLSIGHSLCMATKAGMAGIAFAGARPNMVPTGAKAPGVHNAPLAIAVPGPGPEPVMLDMATSVVAFSWVDKARDLNLPIPGHWTLDANCQPTTDPHAARYARPMGDYKGYCLSFMIECLGALMAGDPQVGPVLQSRITDPRHYENGAVCAINISAFTDVAKFRADVQQLSEAMKALPKADGVKEIYVPNEIEERRREERSSKGIPIPEATFKKLQEVGKRFKVQGPPVKA